MAEKCGLIRRSSPHRYAIFTEIFTTHYKSPTTHSTHTAMLSPLPHSSSRLGERSNCTKEPAAGREIAVPATVASKAPTSCWHTYAPYHWSRRGAPPPPAGSRDAAAERCPGRGRAVGAACRLQRHVSTQRTSSPRPPARHRRHRRFDAFARTRPVDQHRARTPLSDRSGGSSTYPCDVLHERRSAGARARGDRSTVVSQSATSGAAATKAGMAISFG